MNMQTFYGELAPYYKYIVNFHGETDKEVNALSKIFRKYRVHSVLDVACGVGRHSVPFAKHGFNVTGIDFSQQQLKEAQNYAKREKVRVKFLLKDANDFSTPTKYDAAICMWTTIGEEPLIYWKVINNVYNALKPGGIFIIENNDWSKIPKSGEKFVENKYVSKGLKIEQYMHDKFTEHFRVRDAILKVNGKKFTDLCITYIKKPNEWIAELQNVGFKNCRVVRNYKTKKTSVLIVGEK